MFFFCGRSNQRELKKMTYMVGMEVIMKRNVWYESNQIVMNN